MLIVNYMKHPNTSFTVGQVPLKAPEPHLHTMPENKPAPVKTFQPAEKLSLDVKIVTGKETGRPADLPVISLKSSAKAARSAPTASRKAPAHKAAPKKFRPAKPLRLQVKVSSAAPEKAAAPVRPAPKRKASGNGVPPAKKGK